MGMLSPAFATPELPVELPADKRFTTVEGRLQGVAIPEGLQALVREGWELGNVFDVGRGIKGWVIRPNSKSKYQVAYTFEGNEDLVIRGGSMFDSAGRNVTVAQLRAADYPRFEKAPGLWGSLERSAGWIALGAQGEDVKAVVYMTYSPRLCINCQALREAMRPYEAAGLQVRWALNPRIAHEDLITARIYAAEDPRQALEEYLASPQPPDRIPSLQPPADKLTLFRVDEMAQTLRRYEVPYSMIVFKDRMGNTFQLAAEAAVPRLGVLTGLR